MKTCYKCGRPTTNTDPECDECAQGQTQNHRERPRPVGVPDCITAAIEAARIDYERRAVLVDWQKIKTVEDLILVLSTFSSQLVVLRGTPEFERLKHLLKDS